MPTLRPIMPHSLRPIMPHSLSLPHLLSLRTALALGAGLAAFGSLPATAQTPAPDATAPATPPGPVEKPAPAPGTAVPAPNQPAAAPTPPGTATAPAAPAAAPAAPPPNYKMQYNGLIDAYYQFQFHNPKDTNVLTGRAYDIRHNTPTLELAALNVFATPAPKKFGYYATFFSGDLADLNHGSFVGTGANGYATLVHNDLGEGRYKNVQQLYGTYAFGADGSGVDFGKFLSPFGYEVPFANADYNYSRSIAYYYTPAYHAGLRIYTPIPGFAPVTATFYLVNGVFNTATMGVQNDSKRPGYMGQLVYTDPKGKIALTSELGLDKQKFYGETNPGTKVVENDNNFTYNFTANTLVGIDYLYRKTTPDGGGKETVNAYAFYFRNALTPKTAVALRFSGSQDKFEGNAATVIEGLSGDTTAKPYEITATYELKPTAAFTTRLEYRHDNSNQAIFDGGDSLPDKKNQDTLTLAGMFTF